MRKAILIFSVLFMAMVQAKAQKDKITGHWLILKIYSLGSESLEISPQYFEKKMFKLITDSVKRALTPEDSSGIKDAANEAYKQVEGSYFQFNPDGTFAVSYKAGDVNKGRYTINEKKHSITLKWPKSEVYYYTFNNNNLTLTSDDGQVETELTKRQNNMR